MKSLWGNLATQVAVPRRIHGEEISLRLALRLQPDRELQRVLSFVYRVVRESDGVSVGQVTLRVSDEMTEALYYLGEVGYTIFEPYRGNRYAYKGCLLLKQAALKLGIGKLSITCNPDNHPSRRTCELLGARYLDTVEVPSWHELYDVGDRQKRIYEWTL